MDKDNIKRLCQGGVLDQFLELSEIILKESEDIKWDGDKDKLLYAVGKRDGARELLSSLEDYVKNIAKQ